MMENIIETGYIKFFLNQSVIYIRKLKQSLQLSTLFWYDN